MPPIDSPAQAFAIAAAVIAFGIVAGILAGLVHGAIVSRRNARLAARRAAELDERLARHGVSPDRQKIVRLCECGHGANYHGYGRFGCYRSNDRGDLCECQHFTPHPPLFDELAEPDAFEDREDPSSTIGRAS